MRFDELSEETLESIAKKNYVDLDKEDVFSMGVYILSGCGRADMTCASWGTRDDYNSIRFGYQDPLIQSFKIWTQITPDEKVTEQAKNINDAYFCFENSRDIGKTMYDSIAELINKPDIHSIEILTPVAHGNNGNQWTDFGTHVYYEDKGVHAGLIKKNVDSDESIFQKGPWLKDMHCVFKALYRTQI